ncbi:MAG: universal stress protein [Nocardioidaceae bacterium]|nr:universal stress protein [Nocardioidaceae bacterium]
MQPSPADDADAPAPRIEPAGRGTVVVGHDGPGAADHALRRAGELARRLDDVLVVVRAYSLAGDAPWASSPPRQDPSASEVGAVVTDELRRDVARVLGHHDGAVLLRVEHATAVRALTAVSDGADMLMLGSHGAQAGPRHDDHPGSVSRRCLRDATCPVLLVGPGTDPAPRGPVLPRRRTPDEPSPWTPSRHHLEVLIGAGTLAPSMHNTQPWTFWTAGADLCVGLDGARLLPAEDPGSRAAVLSVGAVVTNLRCQGAAGDLGTDVTWLPPSRNGRTALAAVHLDPGADVDHELATLALSIPLRRTRRRPMSGRPLTASAERDLALAASSEGARLLPVPRGTTREALLELVDEAALLDRVDDPRHLERDSWTGGVRTADGIPERSFGQQDRGRAVIRDFAPGVPSAVRGWAAFEPDAPLYLLGTVRDDEIGWLRAGAALEHLWLVATSRGLAMSFLNQVLERDDLRRRTRALVDDAVWPHMVVRLGYGDPPVATPRRPWQSFLT